MDVVDITPVHARHTRYIRYAHYAYDVPQVFLQIAAIHYYSYQKDQSAAGTLIGLSCMLSSIGCAIAGAYWQTVYEQELHVQNPDRFPPNPIFHGIEKFQRWREQRRARLEISQEVEEGCSQRTHPTRGVVTYVTHATRALHVANVSHASHAAHAAHTPHASHKRVTHGTCRCVASG